MTYSKEDTLISIEMQGMKKDIESNRKTLERIENKLDKFIDTVEKHYVTNSEFKPVRLIVYGLAGTIMLGFLAALIDIIFKR